MQISNVRIIPWSRRRRAKRIKQRSFLYPDVLYNTGYRLSTIVRSSLSWVQQDPLDRLITCLIVTFRKQLSAHPGPFGEASFRQFLVLCILCSLLFFPLSLASPISVSSKPAGGFQVSWRGKICKDRRQTPGCQVPTIRDLHFPTLVNNLRMF